VTAHGIVAAMVTPFSSPGTADLRNVQALAEHLVACGVDGLFPLGTNGEGLLLSMEERKRVAEAVIAAAGGVPVYVHVGAVRLPDVLDLSRHAERAGASGIAVLTPLLFRVRDDEMVDYYSTVCEAASPGCEVYIYNFPANTGNDVTPNVLDCLLDRCPNIKGIKFSSSDFLRLEEYLTRVSDAFAVLVGNDNFVYPALCMGASGSVSGNSNVVPKLFVELYRAFCAGDHARARSLQEDVNTVARLFGYGENLSLIKYGLASSGIQGGVVNPPLRDMDPGEAQAMLDAMDVVKAWT
jgi:dihydrodipicolinate synthase/N-acetylneuraminate lyase